MRRIAGIATAVTLFVAAAATPADATTHVTDGTSNTIAFGEIAKSKLGDASLNAAGGTGFFKSVGGLHPETESFMDYTDDA